MNNHSAAIIYVRVSTFYQTGKKETGKYSSGPALNGQIEICKRFYNDMFPNRVDPIIVSDVGSSFNDKYKLVNLDNMINNMDENTLIIIHDISRLGRNVYQTFSNVYESVELKKSKIYSVIDKKLFGHDRLEDMDFFRQSVEAEAESAKRSAIAKERNNYIRSIGGHVGNVPFGKKVKRMKTSGEYMKRVLINDSAQQRSIRDIIRQYEKGFKVSIIKNELIRKKHTNNGKPISIGVIRGVINKYKNTSESDRLTDNLESIDFIDYGSDVESNEDPDNTLIERPDNTLIDRGRKRQKKLSIDHTRKRQRQTSPISTKRRRTRTEDDFVNETSLLIHDDNERKQHKNNSLVPFNRVRTRSMTNSEKSEEEGDNMDEDGDDSDDGETRLYKRIARR